MLLDGADVGAAEGVNAADVGASVVERAPLDGRDDTTADVADGARTVTVIAGRSGVAYTALRSLWAAGASVLIVGCAGPSTTGTDGNPANSCSDGRGKPASTTRATSAPAPSAGPASSSVTPIATRCRRHPVRRGMTGASCSVPVTPWWASYAPPVCARQAWGRPPCGSRRAPSRPARTAPPWLPGHCGGCGASRSALPAAP